MRSMKPFFSLLLAVFLLLGCVEDPNKAEFYSFKNEQVMINLDRERDDFRNEPIRPLPSVEFLAVSPGMAALGNRLYHDTRLSGDNSMSCASCHNLEAGGDDGLQFSRGINNATGDINAPTVLNSGFNFVQFWNGRAKDLQDQAAGPVTNPVEMGGDWNEVVEKLRLAGDYDSDFKREFGDPEITPERVTKAIAEFEKILVTPSAFDRFLLGETSAISQEAKKGYALFKSLGCVSCHQGVNVGGNLYQKFGAIQAYYEVKTQADLGRQVVTEKEDDQAVFKVPSLRNVANTAPYFHNGAAPDLPTAIRVMGLVQLGRNLDEKDIEYLQAFLESLSGEKDVRSIIADATSGVDHE